MKFRLAVLLALLATMVIVSACSREDGTSESMSDSVGQTTDDVSDAQKESEVALTEAYADAQDAAAGAEEEAEEEVTKSYKSAKDAMMDKSSGSLQDAYQTSEKEAAKARNENEDP